MAKRGNVVAKALGVEDIGARLAARRARRKAARHGPPPPVPPALWHYPPPAPPGRQPPPAGPYGAPGIPRPAGGVPPAPPSAVVSPPPGVPLGRPGATSARPPRHSAAAGGDTRDAPGMTRTAPGAAEVAPQAWEVLAEPRREPVWLRARRVAMVAAAVMVVAAGVLTITGQVMEWMAPPVTAPRRVAVSDAQFAAVATPFAVDYLSWAESDPRSRQAALARSAAPDTTVDGWGGTGRQWADSPTAIGVTRLTRSANSSADSGAARGGERAVVTVRVRVTPFTANDPTSDTPQPSTEPSPPAAAPEPRQPSTSTSTPGSEQEAVPNVASGSVPREPGWTAGVPRWLTVAIPVAVGGDGRVVVTAVPALVGSPQTSAHPPVSDASEEDARFARDTRGVITTLMRAYGTGELQYARAEGTSFSGLNGAVELVDVLAWRAYPSNADGKGGGKGGGDAVRVGDVTVTWSLSGGAGTLRCTYRVELRADAGGGGRWYLASIGAAPVAVS
jgi:hypothetical protein